MNARIDPSLGPAPEPSPTPPSAPARAEAAARSVYRRFVRPRRPAPLPACPSAVARELQ